MPAAKPPEFRRRALDLVAAGEPVARVAKDFGVSESCLRRWMETDAIDSGRAEGLTSAEKRELSCDAATGSWRPRSRSSNARVRTSPGRTSSQNDVPVCPGVGRAGVPGLGDVPGVEGELSPA
ncbi:helix-turn-helix domain-containing protein [Blastococcus sp. Marseille-P5729]|uniref:helix-turn-helix domain-containing protein n=1 Tax=Blastococcus sp. Marseille-P5729 TaxID=2086582 RepID=UPI000D0FF04F